MSRRIASLDKGVGLESFSRFDSRGAPERRLRHQFRAEVLEQEAKLFELSRIAAGDDYPSRFTHGAGLDSAGT